MSWPYYIAIATYTLAIEAGIILFAMLEMLPEEGQ